VSRPASLPAWLAYLESLHPKAIAMGLDRVRSVRANLDAPVACPTIVVGGTNGKGSTCAMLQAILRCAGYRVGAYTSPHLLQYNERVRLPGRLATDAELVLAFNAVEDARLATPDAQGAPTSLTYFEFGTLAALWLFARSDLDALILEVGLGGRLDAVNIVDGDVAVLTSVDLDHMDYLGLTRSEIGFEKAGIFRPGRPVVCAEPDPPPTVLHAAATIGARLLRVNRDYGYANEGGQWRYRGPGGERYGLPFPALRGAYQLGNAAAALTALAELRLVLAVSAGAVREGLSSVELPGRFQTLPGRPTIVLDVAHNPHAARALADALGAQGFFPETLAVFGMYADKDIDGVIATMTPRVERWYVATLPGPRGASEDVLRKKLVKAGVASRAIRSFADVAAAYAAAKGAVGEADRIVVFGSFLTVAAALAAGR
jgi:dihydrofolate synthase/folylpolyglutamate synthase